MNTFGKKLRLTTFGESHGKAMGGVLDGFPSGFLIDFDALQKEIDKRKPGNSHLTSLRKESDIPEFLSGISEDGITLGSPIAFIVRNEDTRPSDYSSIKNCFRPNHADYTYFIKYGISPLSGGGRASARETVSRVVAGAIVLQWLEKQNIDIKVFLSKIGNVSDEKLLTLLPFFTEEKFTYQTDSETLENFKKEILKTKKEGDSIGGQVTCMITGLNPGLGDPVGDKLQARLAEAMLSINAVKGFEYGCGFSSSGLKGSETADSFAIKEDRIVTKTNYSGGIQGGIANGMPVYFNVTFKPTPSISKPLSTIDNERHTKTIEIEGRHDPCIAIRGMEVVKSMAALTVADLLL